MLTRLYIDHNLDAEDVIAGAVQENALGCGGQQCKEDCKATSPKCVGGQCMWNRCACLPLQCED